MYLALWYWAISVGFVLGYPWSLAPESERRGGIVKDAEWGFETASSLPWQ